MIEELARMAVVVHVNPLPPCELTAGGVEVEHTG